MMIAANKKTNNLIVHTTEETSYIDHACSGLIDHLKRIIFITNFFSLFLIKLLSNWHLYMYYMNIMDVYLLNFEFIYMLLLLTLLVFPSL